MSSTAEKWRMRVSKREFVSSLEAIQPAEELFFPVTRPFGKYDKYLRHASEHPAKMNVSLIEFLVKRYTKAGDVIFDPMAGSGSVGVVAATLDRNAVQIELVPKFYRWMEQARENFVNDPAIKEKGWISNFRSDARKALKYVGQEEIDCILFSPPYGDQNHSSNSRSRLGQLARSKSTGVGKQAARGKYKFSYSRSRKNIGNLRMERYFEAMSIVCSQCHKALREGGLTIVVVRPLYRNKNIFDLPHYTWLLLKEAGFEFVNIYKLKLARLSLWTNLYEKKYPGVPKIRHDYVIVVRKPRETRILMHVRIKNSSR
jgi:DNA modification methylase